MPIPANPTPVDPVPANPQTEPGDTPARTASIINAAGPIPAPRPIITASRAPASEPMVMKAGYAAPEPPVRPATKTQDFARTARAAPRQMAAENPSPTNVRTAASRHGLELEGINLIGVLEAETGPLALLRSASGDVETVEHGDSFEGWRVGMISRDSIQLSKDGQSRTLRLVLR